MIKKIFIPFIAILALFLSAYNFVSSLKKDKTGYVLLSDLYEAFEMSKEYKIKIEAVENKRKDMLDSLKLDVYKAEKIGTKEFEYAKQLYFYKEQEFEKSNEQVKAQFDEQIWKQINQYLSEYGKENNYSYIYGANGDGSFMYVKPSHNITEDVTQFINKKYKGK